MAEDDDLVELYDRAVAGFGELVHAVGPDQWIRPTPCDVGADPSDPTVGSASSERI